MKCLMLLIPALVSLALLWWNGRLFWMFSLVAGMAALTWLCVRTMSSKQNNLAEGFPSDFRDVRVWELVTGLTIWAHWIACLVGIVLALLLDRDP